MGYLLYILTYNLYSIPNDITFDLIEIYMQLVTMYNKGLINLVNLINQP